MSLRVRAFAAAVSIVFLFTTTAVGQFARRSFGDGTLTITVRDSKNLPVESAHVEVRSLAGRQGMFSGYTNHAGIFEAYGIGDGQYEVVVQKGLTQASDRVDVGAGSGMAAVRLDDSNVAGNDIAGNAAVSVAQYKVPKNARKEFNKAQSAVDERNLESAHKHIAKALELYPDFAEALTLRGLLNLEAKNTDAAIRDLDQAIKTDPSYSLAYFGMGAAFNLAQRFDEALRVLDRGIAISPQAWQGYFEVAKAHMGKSEYPAAIRALDKAQSISDGKYPLIHLLKAHAMLALKQYPDAMTELQAFIDEAPKSPEAENARTTLEQVKAFAGQR